MFLLACGLTSGGCFQFASVLTVNPNGSGTIQQRVLFTPAALAQMKGLAPGRRNAPENAEPVSKSRRALRRRRRSESPDLDADRLG